MKQLEINAAIRDVQGKGASRRLRRDGKVPAIVYGAGKEPVSIELQHKEAAQKTEHEAFYSSILTLKVAGAEERVVLKDLQRHPVKPRIMHMDFLRVAEKEQLTMRVPLHFINQSDCIGVNQHGGVISHLLTELEITCLPKDLPEYIEIDVGPMDIGDTVHLTDLIIPEGVEITALAHGADGTRPVVSVHMPRIVAEAASDEEGEPAAEDSEQTPAAEDDES